MNQKKSRTSRRSQAENAHSKRPSWVSRSRLLVAGAVLVVAALVGVGLLVVRDTGPAPAVPVSSASAVSLSGVDPITGKEVSLADFAGKPVVLNVWGSWCEGCNAEATDLRKFGERHPEVQIVGIDLQDSKDGARAFYAKWKWTHPSVFDPDGQISFDLGLQGTPTTFFLDREHRIVTRIVGATDLAGFEEGLRQATSGA